MNWPILKFELTIPFLSVRTHLLCQRTRTSIREFVMVYITLYRWTFHFELYDTKSWKDYK